MPGLDGNSVEAVFLAGSARATASSITSGSGCVISTRQGASPRRSPQSSASWSIGIAPNDSMWSVTTVHSRSSLARRYRERAHGVSRCRRSDRASVSRGRDRRRLPRQRCLGATTRVPRGLLRGRYGSSMLPSRRDANHRPAAAKMSKAMIAATGRTGAAVSHRKSGRASWASRRA